MRRRDFLLASGAAGVTLAAEPAVPPVTVLCGDRAVAVKVRPRSAQSDSKDLWVRSADLPDINSFHVKPQGACKDDLCIPIPKAMKSGEWFNLSSFARKVRQPVVTEAGVWSFGEIPVLRGDFYESRVAPDFSVPDRAGKIVHLSDFRGRKILILTWASW